MARGEGDSLTYFCEAIRKDDPNPVIGRFSVADAKRAGLWKETPTVTKKSRDGGTYQADSGPWYSYQPRMLQMRARGFCLRDACPDVLRGLITAEEAADSVPFEETGLTPRIDPTPGPIVAAAPAEPRKITIAEWLDGLETRLRAAATTDEVDAIMAEEEVQKANDKLRNGGRKRFDMIVAEALDRTKPKQPTSDVAWDDAPDQLPDAVTNAPENAPA